MCIVCCVSCHVSCRAVVHLECGQYLLQRDLANAQVYCDSFVAPLDQYKAEAGAYPARLSALPFYAEQLKAEANKTLGTTLVAQVLPAM